MEYGIVVGLDLQLIVVLGRQWNQFLSRYALSNHGSPPHSLLFLHSFLLLSPSPYPFFTIRSFPFALVSSFSFQYQSLPSSLLPFPFTNPPFPLLPSTTFSSSLLRALLFHSLICRLSFHFLSLFFPLLPVIPVSFPFFPSTSLPFTHLGP